MTEWGVVVVIIALVGLFATVIPPIVKLTKAITELTTTMRVMDRQVTELTTTNKESHQRLWDKNEEQDETINDHEIRIGILEHTKGEKAKA